MTALIFGYAQARRITLDLELGGRRVNDSGIWIRGSSSPTKDVPFKGRLGRTLINWGEQLVAASPDRVARNAA